MLQNRVECQLRTPCTPRTGREWAHCTIRHTAGKPPEQISAETGIPIKRLMKISAPQGDTHARVEELAAICQSTGRYEWLRFHARNAGCEIFVLPSPATGPQDAAVLDQTCESLRTLSSVVDTLRDITRDRQISSEERGTFDDVVGRHLACIARLQAWVDRESAAQLARETQRGAALRRALQ